MPSRYASPRKGNPLQFTVDQHVFPRSGIARFIGADGKVELQSLRSVSSRRKVPTATVFCAERAWDQNTETWRTRGYEGRFHSLADEIAGGRKTRLSPDDDKVVSEFFALWTARHRARHNPTGDVIMNGVIPDPPITDEHAENLEANGYAYARGKVMPSHILTGIRMKLQMDRSAIRLDGVHWGIVRASYGEFLVPDNNDGFAAVPLTPQLCLLAESGDVEASPVEVATINYVALLRASEYYFGRNLASCPILRRSIPWNMGEEPLPARTRS